MEIFLDLKDIEITGEFIGDVRYKPTTPIYVSVVFAFALLFINNWAARALAVFIAVVAAFVYFKVEDKKILSVYSDCILVYDKDGEKALKINNCDIESYDTGLTEQYKIYIKLKDGRQIFRESYSMNDSVKYLRKALPKKTTQEVKKEKNKNVKLDPVKGIKSLFGFKKKGE